MQALEVLALQPLSAPQVAAALQVHPRTARRMLNRLREEGYLSRSDDRHRLYSPTLRIVALAGHIVEHMRVAREVAPLVERLAAETGGDAHLMVPSYRSALCVVHAPADGAATPGLHELAPAHCTAAGKVLLAYRQEWRDSVLRSPLERRTARTITDAARFREEADAVRARGYALEDREYDDRTRGAAAPVLGDGGEVVAALAVTLRGAADAEALAPLVLRHARAHAEAQDG